YDVQDRLFKRLAFFVEKSGFRGSLASDSEIQDLHGWNAHDYRAADLAAFFEAARVTNFPLLDEEKELRDILLHEGIIISNADGSVSAGIGGIISISRSSEEYLRYRFMAHECFHGLFFIDENFRDFCRGRWFSLSGAQRSFITSYFDYKEYDINDEYLMINEFMAYNLQQPASAFPRYFRQTLLPGSLYGKSLRKSGGTDIDARLWPNLGPAFTREAQAFSDYVQSRWGLSGGRVWLVQTGVD
ncbi:MAG: hypothetical protein FWF29_04985, partial [Treponema sp.]|nr:hypothetical protein [Treponema sp.]